jgi:hypothetical protein
MSSAGRVDERRLFSRFACCATAVLRQEGLAQTATLVDISLNGALLELPSGSDSWKHDRFQLEIAFGDRGAACVASAAVVHRRDNRLGCQFLDIEPDSIERLREMVLSLGKPDEL